MTTILFLDGPDGGGHSTHADALARALAERGIDAIAWHHPVHPAGAVGRARVEHYIDARRALWALCNAVVVVDRGPFSGLVHARSVRAGAMRPDGGTGLASVDCATFGVDCSVAYLDAADATLDARLILRGEDPAASHGERGQWRRLAAAEGWPVIATDGDRDGVTRALLTWALRVLA